MARKSLSILLVISTLIFCSSMNGETVSTLLDEGIYAEETQGDLDQAIKIYQQIIAESENDLKNIARVYYRLGNCFLKKGDNAKAEEVFQELIARFPDQEQIISAAKSQMGKTNTLELGPEPWTAGETCRYEMQTSSGMVSGEQVWMISDGGGNGDDHWRIRQYEANTVSNFIQYSRTVVLKHDFTPVSIELKNNRGVFNASYKDDHIDIDIEQLNTKMENRITYGDTVYDKESGLYLIRRLPLVENYEASVSVFVIEHERIFRCKIRCSGKETLTVPAGTFDCYVIEVEDDSGEKGKLWYSTDGHKYLVKYDYAQKILELKRIVQMKRTDINQFMDADLGISISAPENWQFIKYPEAHVPTGYKLALQILPSELQSWAAFIVGSHGGAIQSAQDAANRDAEAAKKMIKEYSIRPESKKEIEIGGLPASMLIADYKDRDENMVDYRTYIFTADNLYWFVFRTEKEAFEKNKRDFDTLVESFKVKQK